MHPTKTICIVGVTGNQGGSVAQRFLQDPTYHVRGLTRDPSSTKAQELAAQGIEIVQANLDDTSSLKSAFAGANIIFSVTNYWEPFFRADCRQNAAELGISCRKYAYDVEYQQGKNIADAAAATAETLDENGFIVSTLSQAGRCSGGKFEELYHFDAKADIFPSYVQSNYPELARKMSCVQTGYFMSSYKLVPDAYFGRADDGSFEMAFPTAPDAAVPHFNVNADMGNFVYAVAKMPPGKSYMAEGTTCSWTEYMRLWSKVNSVPASYRQITLEELIDRTPDAEFGREVGDMFAYSTEPGYDGGDRELLHAADIRKAGIDCPMTSLEHWMKEEDWSSVLQKA
ncbi:NAD dependent epimerase/dehydratase [Aspergillus flavus]|nr:NAD dependent epimerase/dehydratase [Aspergillus flavus]RAQ80365.1 NAD dependent epimerase/dehydratase [Aspergillus flavus]